jgi:hypothetical protein
MVERDGGYDGVWQGRLRDGMLPLVGVGLGDRNTPAGLAIEYRAQQHYTMSYTVCYMESCV